MAMYRGNIHRMYQHKLHQLNATPDTVDVNQLDELYKLVHDIETYNTGHESKASIHAATPDDQADDSDADSEDTPAPTIKPAAVTRHIMPPPAAVPVKRARPAPVEQTGVTAAPTESTAMTMTTTTLSAVSPAMSLQIILPLMMLFAVF